MRWIVVTGVALVAGLVFVAKALPWWGVIALIAGLVVGGKVLGGWAMRRAFLLPFKAKGAVLRGARVEVHAVTPADPPVPAEGDEADDDGPRVHYLVDVTITPREPSGGFRHWEPTELLLVRPGSRSVAVDDLDDDACTTHDVLIHDGSAFVPDSIGKHEGPVRLRMHVGARPGIDRLAFGYYFEEVGEVRLAARISA